MRKIILYNIIIITVLFGTMEITTRSISWLTGRGFTLALHELDPFHRKIKKLYQWHPFIGFTFQPNSVLTGSHPRQKEKADIYIDQHGFLARDKGLSIHKGKDEVRIATIGGSTTASLNLTYEQNWPGRLGALVQKAYPDKKIRIINAGIPGFNTVQSIGNLALRVMPFKPDIVIVYHAYNDLKAIRKDLPFKFDYSHIHPEPYGFQKPPNFVLRCLENSMLYVRTRNLVRTHKLNLAQNHSNLPNDRLAAIPIVAEHAFEAHIRTLTAIARSGGATVLLSSFATLHDPGLNWESQQDLTVKLSDFQKACLGGLYQFTPGLTVPAIFKGFKRYNSILEKVAHDVGTIWVDNGNQVPHNDQFFVDRVHFSAAGAERMAQNIAPHIIEFLRKQPCDRI